MTSIDPVDGPPTTAPERADMKRRLSVAYDRGRNEARSHRHRGGGLLGLIVGLVAVIRKILFVLSSEATVSTAELALLIAMIAVFVAALILVSRYESSEP